MVISTVIVGRGGGGGGGGGGGSRCIALHETHHCVVISLMIERYRRVVSYPDPSTSQLRMGLHHRYARTTCRWSAWIEQ